MPTYLQLNREPEWGAETTPQSIIDLINRLMSHYGLTLFQFGTKGDNNHLYGYHRSRAWVAASVYCTNRTYSATETPGNRKPGDANWVCALDATLPHDELIAACHRLDVAVRAGRLEKVTEWYGNDDGDQRVDGYDNIRNVVASSDPSHLWHLHMSIDRGRANEDHSDIFAILTGTEPPPQPTPEDKMVIFCKDPAGNVYRCDGITCVPVPPEQVITQTYVYAGLGEWAAVGAKANAVGPVFTSAVQVLTAAPGVLSHLAVYEMGIFGSYPSAGGAPSGAVDLTDAAVAKVAVAVADEDHRRSAS